MVTPIGEDLVTREVIADPYTYYGRLREEDPVHWNDEYEVWIITRYDDVVWLIRHHEMFSSALKNDPRPPYPEIYESDLELYEYFMQFEAEMVNQHDRPSHLEMRKVVHGYFTPKPMEAWRPLVKSAIKDLLDAAEERGHMDVMRDFAVPLPVLVIAQMMGVPRQERPYIREISEKLLLGGQGGPGEPDRMRLMRQCIQEIYDYVSPLVDERMANPGDDFISVLAAAEKSGAFTRPQVVANTALLLIAGHETTLNLICNGTLSFIRNPDQWELFKQDPSGMTRAATEECLRYDSPVKSLPRITLQDVEIGGKIIRKDDRVRWVMSSANRDPRKFDQPDKFDITRWPNPHVAFGAGIHHCLGATLARIEGQEAFKALVERFPKFQLETDALEYKLALNLRSLESLPVSWN